jgi:hypothetical protein
VCLAADTTVDIEYRQVEAWRRLSPAERWQLVSDTTRAVVELLPGFDIAVRRPPKAGTRRAPKPAGRAVHPERVSCAPQ